MNYLDEPISYGTIRAFLDILRSGKHLNLKSFSEQQLEFLLTKSAYFADHGIIPMMLKEHEELVKERLAELRAQN